MMSSIHYWEVLTNQILNITVCEEVLVLMSFVPDHRDLRLQNADLFVTQVDAIIV